MNKRTFTTLIFLLAGIIIMGSCTDKYVAKPSSSSTEVKFSTDIQPVFNSNCKSCHPPQGNPNLDLNAGNSYASLMSINGMVVISNPSSSLLYQSMIGGMSTHCTQQDADKVLGWITQGAKNN